MGRSRYTTVQSTFKRVKLIRLAGTFLLWVLGPLVVLAGNIDRGMTIMGFGLTLIGLAKVMRWWHHS